MEERHHCIKPPLCATVLIMTLCAVYRRSLPADAHEQLKRRLFDLLQRNREFRSLLLAGNIVPTQVGGLTFGALATDDDQLDVLPSPGKFFDMVRTNDVLSAVGVCLLSFFLIWGDTRSLRMPALRPASQAGPMCNPRKGTSVVLHDTIRLA